MVVQLDQALRRKIRSRFYQWLLDPQIFVFHPAKVPSTGQIRKWSKDHAEKKSDPLVYRKGVASQVADPRHNVAVLRVAFSA